MNRTVTVKGLSEREVLADIAIWPIKFQDVDNDLSHLYSVMESKTNLIMEFLQNSGFKNDEISISPPTILDRQAQGYDSTKITYRFTGSSTITVYSNQVDLVRQTMQKLVELGKQGITIVGQDYDTKTEFLFTKLNDVKPEMIEEATKKAREVADKFAKDSDSTLGKIKTARQGRFSITDRDKNTPYIKKVRVVSTLQYYLTD
jgi:hypothetical protein